MENHDGADFFPVDADCDQADFQADYLIIETGETDIFIPATVVVYNFPVILNTDAADLVSDVQINSCKITPGCD